MGSRYWIEQPCARGVVAAAALDPEVPFFFLVSTMTRQTTNTDWTLVITPGSRWFRLDWRGIWQYRDLVFLLARRDVVAIYQQTILGPAWLVVQPIAMTLAFTVVFGKIAGLPTDNSPQFLFYLSGVVPWTFFAACMTKTSNVFSGNAALFGKVYFPRLIVPLSVIGTNLVPFSLQIILLFAFLALALFSGQIPAFGAVILLLPLLIVQMAILGLGVGLLVSSLTTRYRDLAFVLDFGIQLWMYATPVVYPLSQVPERWHWLYLLNPMTGIIEGFRAMLLGTHMPDGNFVVGGLITTMAVFLLGLGTFGRMEKSFMDSV